MSYRLVFEIDERDPELAMRAMDVAASALEDWHRVAVEGEPVTHSAGPREAYVESAEVSS